MCLRDTQSYGSDEYSQEDLSHAIVDPQQPTLLQGEEDEDSRTEGMRYNNNTTALLNK
jgi:hypothetical protein